MIPAVLMFWLASVSRLPRITVTGPTAVLPTLKTVAVSVEPVVDVTSAKPLPSASSSLRSPGMPPKLLPVTVTTVPSPPEGGEMLEPVGGGGGGQPPLSGRSGTTTITPIPFVKLALPGGGKPESRYQACTCRLSPGAIVPKDATIDWNGQL